MSIKQLSQLSLADGLVNSKHLDELDDLNALIDWSEIRRVLNAIEVKDTGNSAYPAIIMFKVLLLQTWYNLSDPQMEKQLSRDLMFRRFTELPLDVPAPDHSTIWRFREKLVQLQLQTPLLNSINDQLHKKRIKIKYGSVAIIDATMVKAHYSEDPDATWGTKKTYKNGAKKQTFGFKSTINVDEDGFVNAAEFTDAAPHDSQVFGELFVEGNAVSFADAAFPSEAHSKMLKERGIENRIHHKAQRNKPLTEAQKQENREFSTHRNTVERVFGQTKQHMNLGIAKYCGKARNAFRTGLIYFCHNIKVARTFFKADMNQHPKSA